MALTNQRCDLRIEMRRGRSWGPAWSLNRTLAHALEGVGKVEKGNGSASTLGQAENPRPARCSQRLVPRLHWPRA